MYGMYIYVCVWEKESESSLKEREILKSSR